MVAPDAGAAGAAPPAGDAEPLVVVELWADVVPKTAENFRCLCTGEKGACAAFGSPPLHYKGNAAHRIVPYQILQAGDITTGDGKGGESIYGRKFADESFDGRAGRHSSKGLLSMANSGRNSNGSQFFITLDAMPHLDGKHVVFGRVVEGMEYVEAIAGAAGAAGDATGKPTRRVVTSTAASCRRRRESASSASVCAWRRMCRSLRTHARTDVIQTSKYSDTGWLRCGKERERYRGVLLPLA